MTKKDTLEDLYSGLQALSKASFPKKCPTCNKIYETAEMYIKETEALQTHNSGLSASYDPIDKQNIVELYRNCSCGSTLMDIFNDRRDLSPNGEKRRQIFQKTLDILIKSGLEKDEARQEILKIMKGESSEHLIKF
jgi:phage FluMu protein Com